MSTSSLRARAGRAMTISEGRARASAFILLGFFVGGCAGATNGVQSQIGELRAQQEREQARLDALRVEIARSEEAAQRAKARATAEKCKADAAHLDAQIATRQAQCLGEWANFNGCEAQNSARAGKGAAWGCVGGILLAAATGGTAAPIALTGCAAGLGAGKMSASNCPTPACQIDPAVLTAQVLAESGLTSWPSCGGYAGFLATNVSVRGSPGLLVQSVVPGTTAEELALQPGDVLVSVAGAPVPDLPSLQRILSAIDLGDPLDIHVMRGGRQLVLRGIARPLPPTYGGAGYGTTMPRPQLGVLAAPTQGTTFTIGVVSAVDPSGPAAAAGIRPGDLLTVPNGAQFPTAEELATALRDEPPGYSIPFVVNRQGAAPFTASVMLADRNGRGGL